MVLIFLNELPVLGVWKKTRMKELMVRGISQLWRKHGSFVVLWFLCLGWAGGEAGSLEVLAFGCFGLPQVIWICTWCDLWWGFGPECTTTELWNFYSGKVPETVRLLIRMQWRSLLLYAFIVSTLSSSNM